MSNGRFRMLAEVASQIKPRHIFRWYCAATSGYWTTEMLGEWCRGREKVYIQKDTSG